MRVNGGMIYNMDKVLRFGVTILNILDNTLMVKNKVKVNTNGLMEVILKAIGLIIRLMVKEYIIGQMVGVT